MVTSFKSYIYLILITPFCFSYTYSQVGINTKIPLGIFYIDPQGNTNEETNYSDDLIIDSNGNMGLGTLTPKAKLDITGKLRLFDGSIFDLTDYILASDNNGKASWKNYQIALRNKSIEWKLENTAWGNINADNKQFAFSGTPTLITAEPGTSTTTESLTVPKGRYLIFMTGDIENINEYAEIKLMHNDIPIMSANYIRSLSGATTYVEFTSTASLWIQFNIHEINSNKNNAIPFLKHSFPFVGPNHIWVNLVLLGLDIGG